MVLPGSALPPPGSIWRTMSTREVSAPSLRRAQLLMRRPHLEDLPDLVAPPGYTLRTYRPGDEAAWAAIMNTGIGSNWTAARCAQELTGRPQFRPDGLFFVTAGTADGPPVGSACAWRTDPDEQHEGVVHMVCVLPEHRGRGLGRVVTLAVLRYFREHGFRSARLSTDDQRLAAVATYLSLGMVPAYPPDAGPGDDHRARWARVLARLRARPPRAEDQ